MISETLYAEYLKERQEAEILENESGFIIYKLTDGECFIIDMFIRPEIRGLGEGHSLVKNLKQIAIASGCKAITANIHLADKNANKTLLAGLHTGFKVVRADQNILLIYMDVGGK